MRKHALCAAAVTSILLSAGCNNPSDPAQTSTSPGTTASTSTNAANPKPTPENTVVIVNGQPISRAFLQNIMTEMTQRSGGQPIPEDKVIDGLIARELLHQEAEKQNLAKDPTVSMKIENAAREILVQANVENFRKTATITDEELKKEYDAKVGALKNVEYKARHILLDSEQAAKDALDKLQKGAKFDELAKKLSKDPSAKQNGGELGWFNPQQMVPEFSAALGGLKNGEITQTPVKSQFGWHIIERESSREQTPPPFDAVKEQFRNALIGQKLQKHVEELKAAAKIERLAPPAPAASDNAEPSAKPQAAAPKDQPVPTENASLEAGKPATATHAPAAKPSATHAPAAPTDKPAKQPTDKPAKQ